MSLLETVQHYTSHNYCCLVNLRIFVRYGTGTFICRHVILPADIAKLVPRTHLMTETEWRNIGVQQSPGWIHYMVHAPGSSTSLSTQYTAIN